MRRLLDRMSWSLLKFLLVSLVGKDGCCDGGSHGLKVGVSGTVEEMEGEEEEEEEEEEEKYTNAEQLEYDSGTWVGSSATFGWKLDGRSWRLLLRTWVWTSVFCCDGYIGSI